MQGFVEEMIDEVEENEKKKENERLGRLSRPSKTPEGREERLL